MNKIGIKILSNLDFDQFEALEYWLDFDFEYDDMVNFIAEQKIITLDMEEDEDREEDVAMLQKFLTDFANEKVEYETFTLNEEWEKVELENLA